MSRLDRVAPSAGRDGIDRKARFPSLLAQAAVLASAPGPGCHLETFGRERSARVSRPRLGEMGHPRLLCVTEQVAPSALPSRFRAVDSRGEIELMENGQNKAKCSLVSPCQIRAYDKQSGGSARPLLADEFQEHPLERNRFAVGQKRNTGVSHGFIFRPWPFL